MTDLKEKTETKINKNKIITAGKQIQDLAFVILFSIVLFVMLGFITSSVKTHDDLVALYWAYSVVGLASTFLILQKLFSAGKNLITAFLASDETI